MFQIMWSVLRQWYIFKPLYPQEDNGLWPIIFFSDPIFICYVLELRLSLTVPIKYPHLLHHISNNLTKLFLKLHIVFNFGVCIAHE